MSLEFKSNRDAAAWLIKQGKKLIDSNVPISEHISRSDNDATFEMGFQLIDIGRRVALGYEFGDQAFTKEIYKAHIRATRKPVKKKASRARKKRDAAIMQVDT